VRSIEYSFLIIHGQVEPGAADAAAVAPSMCTGDCTGGAAHPATCHCIDCGEDYCEQLAAAHRKFRMSRDHTLVPLADKGRAVSTLCSTHPDEKFKSYCATCKLPICMVCVAETHTNGLLVDRHGPADGPKHEVVSLVEAGRVADVSLQVIHVTVSGLADTYGATVSTLQVRECSRVLSRW
jgi:hypothetical protein